MASSGTWPAGCWTSACTISCRFGYLRGQLTELAGGKELARST